MKVSKSILKKFIIILAIAAIPRLVFLDLIPAGVNYDEIDYILNAKTVFHAWTDISGQWNPFSLTTLPDESPKGELPPVILAPFIGPFPFSLFLARFPFSMFGILMVGLVYLIARKLFDKKEGFVAALVVAMNPLAIFSSRLAFDGPLTATLYLSAFTILLYAKKWLILLAVIPLFVAFYSYIGAKLTFLPFTILVVLFSWKTINKGKYTKQYLLVILFAVLVLAHFLIRLPNLPSSDRAGTVITPFHTSVAKEVDNQRRLSLEIPFSSINSIAVNKLVIYFKEVINRSLGAFSSSLLFISGDVYHYFYLWDHGVLYYTDALFLLIGIFFLVKKYLKTTIFFIFLFPVLLLPVVLSSTELSYIYRAYLLYIFLAVIVGVGMWNFVNRFKDKARIIVSVLVIVYGLQFFNFAYDYLVRNPVYHEDQFQITFRVLSRYLVEEEKNNRKIVVMGINPKLIFQNYILYSGLSNELNNEQTREKLASIFSSKKFEWDNLIFTDDCNRPSLSEEETLIMRDDYYCENIQKDFIDNVDDFLAVSRISDSGQEFKIFHGQTCQDISSQTYIRGISFSDLKIEDISLEQFCTKFIVQGF